MPTGMKHIDGLPNVPLLLVANEFLDALPVRQWVGSEERSVTIEDERLAFTLDGEIREDSPARDAAVGAIARHLAEHGGAALVIDYGHARSGVGDTLQAVRRHEYADPLADPGEADLTAHVDFEAVSKAATSAGAAVTDDCRARRMAQPPWYRLPARRRLQPATRSAGMSSPWRFSG